MARRNDNQNQSNDALLARRAEHTGCGCAQNAADTAAERLCPCGSECPCGAACACASGSCH